MQKEDPTASHQDSSILANRTSPGDPPINVCHMLAFSLPHTMRVGKTFARNAPALY